jgi:ABC-type uncharacterized transport system substrate-binding protein
MDSPSASSRKFYEKFLTHLDQQNSNTKNTIQFVEIKGINLVEILETLKKLPDDGCSIYIPTAHITTQASLTAFTNAKIVFQTQQDPLAAKPVGMTDLQFFPRATGVTYHAPIHAKRLELIQQAFLNVEHINVIVDQLSLSADGFLRKEIEAFNLSGHVKASIRVINTVEEFTSLLSTQNFDALYIPYSWLAYRHRKEIVAILREQCHKTVFEKSWFAERGGGLAYEAVGVDGPRELAMHVNWIISNISTHNLAVVSPQQFKLSMNLQHSKKCGHRVSSSFLLRLN